VINQKMRKLIKSILPEVGVGDLKIMPRIRKRYDRDNCFAAFLCRSNPSDCEIHSQHSSFAINFRGVLTITKPHNPPFAGISGC